MIKKKFLVLGICTSIIVLFVYLYLFINFDTETDTNTIKHDGTTQTNMITEADYDAFHESLRRNLVSDERLYLFDGYLDSIPGSDEDGDGVLAPFDFCPRFASEDRLYGCFDTGAGIRWATDVDIDGDGITHTFDHCPRMLGDAEHKGCPAGSKFDTDGDGFLNQDDLCPGSFGVADYLGCSMSVESVMYNGTIHYTIDYKDEIISNISHYGSPFDYQGNQCEGPYLCPDYSSPRYGWREPDFRDMVEWPLHR